MRDVRRAGVEGVGGLLDDYETVSAPSCTEEATDGAKERFLEGSTSHQLCGLDVRLGPEAVLAANVHRRSIRCQSADRSVCLF